MEGKCPVHGSILSILNLEMTCAAKSWSSTLGVFGFWPGSPPATKSRNGYEAIAMRSRGCLGNCRFGPELMEPEFVAEVRIAGQTDAHMVVAADCARKVLRLNMEGSLAEWPRSPEHPRPVAKNATRTGHPLPFVCKTLSTKLSTTVRGLSIQFVCSYTQLSLEHPK